MLLSDAGIFAAVKSGALTIEPLDEECLQPSSYDIHLAGEFLLYTRAHPVIDPGRAQSALLHPVTVPRGGAFDLAPGRFVLASTVETVGLDASLAARVEGKSSLARCGLTVHQAGFIDPGFRGTVTLELSNAAELPIRLRPGMRIGQLCVFTLDQPARRPYGDPSLGSHYQGQVGPRGPAPLR